MSSSALPLKLGSSSSSTGKDTEKKLAPVAPIPTGDISSPHELTAFVETLLDSLDARFDEMSEQLLDRMAQMSTRVDALEASIQDIINGDVVSPPGSPATVMATIPTFGSAQAMSSFRSAGQLVSPAMQRSDTA